MKKGENSAIIRGLMPLRVAFPWPECIACQLACRESLTSLSFYSNFALKSRAEILEKCPTTEYGVFVMETFNVDINLKLFIWSLK